jgi:hypothetical protein
MFAPRIKKNHVSNRLSGGGRVRSVITVSIHPRVVNKTDIIFSNVELKLLEKGLKYNMNTKAKNWMKVSGS